MAKKKKHRARRRHGPIGAPPGNLVAPPGAIPTVVRVLRYNEHTLEEDTGIEAIRKSFDGVVWIDVVGLESLETIQAVGDQFRLHPLALEDVLNLHQRPKSDKYDNHLFIVARMARLLEGDQLDVEQVSFFLTDKALITFQERDGDAFGELRKRIRESRGRVRKKDVSYLTYALLDSLVDTLFPVMERYGEQLEQIEQSIFEHPQPSDLRMVHELRRELMAIRRSIFPLREMLAALVRDESPLISPDVRPFLHDCADHAIQLVDIVETHREHATGLLDGYLSSTGNRTNDVMKVLTVFATIFMPLSFVAGVYGMNFDASSPYNMPELRWAYGYPFVMGLMAVMVVGMLIYFRRKGWF